jgi:GntR family transcriptional repressor for pyruvate dehydrogenase complex
MASALADYILEAGLKEGDPLPSTTDLAEQFGVSRTVVREALAELSGRGVLTRSQGKESVVARPGSQELSSLFQFGLRTGEGATEDIFECRSALELTTARGAAQRATDEDVAELRSLVDHLATAATDEDYHRTDIALHRQIAVASGNRLLVLILDSLADLLREVRVQATINRRSRGAGLDAMVDEHRKIVEAIAAGDAALAEKLMADHLGHTRREYDSRDR